MHRDLFARLDSNAEHSHMRIVEYDSVRLRGYLHHILRWSRTAGNHEGHSQCGDCQRLSGFSLVALG